MKKGWEGGCWLFGYVESALNLKLNPKLRIGGSRERERERAICNYYKYIEEF